MPIRQHGGTNRLSGWDSPLASSLVVKVISAWIHLGYSLKMAEMSVRSVGHVTSPELEAFFRRYVVAVSRSKKELSGIWININTGHEESETFVRQFPCAVGWLPDRSLLGDWLSLRGF